MDILEDMRTAVVVSFAFLFAACAPRRPPESTPGTRIPDSVPEGEAAQRAATPGLQLEDDDARWGVEGAKERKRLREEQKAADAKKKAAHGPDAEPKMTAPVEPATPPAP